MSSQVRTYAWIARQPFNIRYQIDNIEKDNSPETDRFLEENEFIRVSDESIFQRGVFWPSLVLIEKFWEGESKHIEIFIRIFKKKLKLIIDVYMGDNMDIITGLSSKFDIPIYRIITSKKGKRGSVQKLLDFQD
ncbi:MAG: hypothetical protein ACW981_10190 [Candidatus Hodarchaeales archaeon]|jgi:hypothetical protein